MLLHMHMRTHMHAEKPPARRADRVTQMSLHINLSNLESLDPGTYLTDRGTNSQVRIFFTFFGVKNSSDWTPTTARCGHTGR